MIDGDNFVQLAKRTGYEDLRTLRLLYCLVRNIQPSCVLEFGTAFGASAAYMAAAIGKGLIVSIDDYRGDYAKAPNEVSESLYTLGLDKRVRLLHGNTHNASTVLRDAGIGGKFDILFMDADHSHKGLKAEYREASPMLTEEHVVIIDDTQASSPEVRSFIVELASQYAFCIMIRDMHWGITVFCTNSGQAIKVADALEEVSNG